MSKRHPDYTPGVLSPDVIPALNALAVVFDAAKERAMFSPRADAILNFLRNAERSIDAAIERAQWEASTPRPVIPYRSPTANASKSGDFDRVMGYGVRDETEH